MSEIVGIQFLEGGKIQAYQVSGPRLNVDALCVVETEHGPAIARVARLGMPHSDRKPHGNLRRVLRVATPRDLEQRKQNERLERDAYRLCRQKVQEKKLAMKLVDVTYTLEGRKAVFFFTAENRVDFRELVKDLAQALRVKIEMRQIGVRDEARRLGGVGACGNALCCCTFLRDFVSVSIRMAKEQNVSLNPTKVSGICGRLMCCLSYEYDPSRAKRKKGEEKSQGAPDGTPACGAECRGCAAADAVPAPPKTQDRRPAPAGRPGGQGRPGGFRSSGGPGRPGAGFQGSGPQAGARRESGPGGRRPPAPFNARRPGGGNRPEGAQSE